MPARWRDQFEAGRSRVRNALNAHAPQHRQNAPARPAVPAEPFFNAQLYADAREHVAAPDSVAPAQTAEVDQLRALIGELRVVTEEAVARKDQLEARNNELETQLRALAELAEATVARADAMADVLRFPGVRRTLQKMVHPQSADRDADEDELRLRTEASQKLNAVYEWLDRAATEAT